MGRRSNSGDSIDNPTSMAWILKLPLELDDMIPRDGVDRISQQTYVGASRNHLTHKLWPSNNVSTGIKGIMGFL